MYAYVHMYPLSIILALCWVDISQNHGMHYFHVTLCADFMHNNMHTTTVLLYIALVDFDFTYLPS